jgi:hypothetical protein
VRDGPESMGLPGNSAKALAQSFKAPGLPQAKIANPGGRFDSARCLDLCFLAMVAGEKYAVEKP